MGFGLNFNNQAFSQLLQLAEEGHIQILTADVILKELLKVKIRLLTH